VPYRGLINFLLLKIFSSAAKFSIIENLAAEEKTTRHKVDLRQILTFFQIL